MHPNELVAQLNCQPFEHCLTRHSVLVEGPVELEAVLVVRVVIDEVLGAIQIVGATGIEVAEVEKLFNELVVDEVVLAEFDFDVGA